MKSHNRTKALIKELKTMHFADSLIPNRETLIIVIICIAVDALFLSGITENLFTDSTLIIWMTAVMIAFAIDGLPLVMAIKIQKNKKNWMDIIIFGICTLVFCILIVCIFCLRWSMMEVIYSPLESGIVNTIGMDMVIEESSEYVASESEKFMTIVMAIIPFGTSLLTFAAATHKSVKQKKFECFQKNIIMHEAYKQELDAKINETDRELKRDLDAYEQELYKSMKAKLAAMQEILKEQAKLALAMKLGTADAVSELLEEEEKEDE